MSNASHPPLKAIGTRWRFTSPHQFQRSVTGLPCTIADNSSTADSACRDLYPYVVEFDHGKRANALDRELAPLTDSLTDSLPSAQETAP